MLVGGRWSTGLIGRVLVACRCLARMLVGVLQLHAGAILLVNKEAGVVIWSQVYW